MQGFEKFSVCRVFVRVCRVCVCVVLLFSGMRLLWNFGFCNLYPWDLDCPPESYYSCTMRICCTRLEWLSSARHPSVNSLDGNRWVKFAVSCFFALCACVCVCVCVCARACVCALHMCMRVYTCLMCIRTWVCSGTVFFKHHVGQHFHTAGFNIS